MARTQNGTTPYLTSEDIAQEWDNWKATGKVSDKMAKMMYVLASHIMQSRNFNRYPSDVKEEMAQEGVLKILRNLKNMKAEYRKSFFSYWSNCVFTAAITYLSKYYKEMNARREYLLATMEQIQNEGEMTGQTQSPHFQQLMKDLQRTLADYNHEGVEHTEDEE